MSHVFLAINGDGVGESIGSAIISDNHDELARLSSSIKNAHQMIDQWVEGQGGKVIVSSGDEAIYQLPQAALSQIEGVRKKYTQMANTTLTAGVGSTMSEASKALIYGKMNSKNQVVHYEPQIDEMIAGADEEESLPNPEDIQDDADVITEQQQGVDGDTDGEDDQQAQFGDEDNSESGEDDDTGEMNGEQQEQFQDGDTEDLDADPGLDAGEDDLDADENAEQDAAAAQPPVDDSEIEDADIEDVDIEDADAEDMDDSQPAHEQGLSPEQDMEHDAEENEDDEQDADNIEADEEPAAFGGNTEPADDDLEDDIADDVVNQTINDAEGEMGDEDAMAQDDDDMAGDPTAEGIPGDENAVDEDGMVDDDMVDDDMSEDADGEGVLSEMMHANMGDEQAEDNDEEIKQDIVESLMSFKQNKMHLEELKQSNPELYQANIMMLRAMIQMAKKYGLNPDRAAAEAEHASSVQDTFPQNDTEDDEDTAPVEKAEKSKGVHQAYMNPGESMAGELSREGKRKPGKFGEQNKEVARSFHKQKIKELKQIKPNLPKNEDMGKAESMSRNIWHPSKMKAGDSVHFEGKHYKVHSQRSQAEPSAKTKKPRYYTTLVPHKEAEVKKNSKNITLPKKQLINEHKQLIQTLQSTSHKDDKKEAKKQRKELAEYVQKNNTRQVEDIKIDIKKEKKKPEVKKQ